MKKAAPVWIPLQAITTIHHRQIARAPVRPDNRYACNRRGQPEQRAPPAGI